MLNELEVPTCAVSLDVSIPEIPELKHDMGKVEEFSHELVEFYEGQLDNLSVDQIKKERTKIRKIMTTVADNRKKAVKAFKNPIKDFEDTSKRIEKNLKELDDKMKEIVDSSKVEDPFAGLTTSTVIDVYSLSFSCSKEDYEDIVNYIRKKGIDV